MCPPLPADRHSHHGAPGPHALPRGGIYSPDPAGPPVCRWQIMGLLSLHDHMSQFFIINLFLLCVCIVRINTYSVSLENPDQHWPLRVSHSGETNTGLKCRRNSSQKEEDRKLLTLGPGPRAGVVCGWQTAASGDRRDAERSRDAETGLAGARPTLRGASAEDPARPAACPLPPYAALLNPHDPPPGGCGAATAEAATGHCFPHAGQHPSAPLHLSNPRDSHAGLL